MIPSFIAFPRKVDTSYLKSAIDESKNSKVKDLKGTKWKSLYAGFPEDTDVYLGDVSDLEELLIYEKDSATSFRKVFKNQFIYVMYGRFMYCAPDLDLILKKAKFSRDELFYYASLGKKESLSNIERNNEYILRDKMRKKLDENGSMWYALRCRKQLYDLIKFNTTSGETVEIYTDWGSGYVWVSGKLVAGKNTDKLGPPKKVKAFNVEEILTSDLFDAQEDGFKTVIHNTG